MLPDSPLVFTETQLFRQHWRWLLVALTLVAVGLSVVVVLNAPSWPALLLLAGVLGPLLAGLWTMKLEVRLDVAGIHYRYPPVLWHWRHWPWTTFRQVFPRTYEPFFDYGGWGIRGLPGNLLYNVAGPDGLQLAFRSGNRLLLGTQQPKELRVTLAALLAAYPTLPITLPAVS